MGFPGLAMRECPVCARGENMADIKAHGRNFFLRKTHCVNGHEFSPENTKISAFNGQRVCVACRRESDRRFRERRRRLA